MDISIDRAPACALRSFSASAISSASIRRVFACSGGAHGDEDRAREVYLQLHSERHARGHMRFKTEQRAFAALAAFTHLRQVSPDRRIGGCEVDANRLISSWGERPVERRANVVDLSDMARQVI